MKFSRQCALISRRISISNIVCPAADCYRVVLWRRGCPQVNVFPVSQFDNFLDIIKCYSTEIGPLDHTNATKQEKKIVQTVQSLRDMQRVVTLYFTKLCPIILFVVRSSNCVHTFFSTASVVSRQGTERT